MENKNGFFVAHMDSYSSLFFVGKNDSWETWTPSIEKKKNRSLYTPPKIKVEPEHDPIDKESNR